MTVTSLERNGDVTIYIDGRFVFSCHREFNCVMYMHKGDDMCYTVDLSNTTYLDSAALGMLLLLRDHVDGDASRVRLRYPSVYVKEILELANFNHVFTII